MRDITLLKAGRAVRSGNPNIVGWRKVNSRSPLASQASLNSPRLSEKIQFLRNKAKSSRKYLVPPSGCHM